MSLRAEQVILFAFFLWQATSGWQLVEGRKCEPMRSAICRKLGYNFTILPNYFGHKEQRQAMTELQSFNRVRDDPQCSKHIDNFICSMYFPMCTVLQTVIPPCQSLCLQAKSACEPFLRKFGYTWPRKLNCAKFPKLNTGQTCVFHNRSSSAATNRSSSLLDRTPDDIDELPLRERQKFCWKSSGGANKRCCRHGNKAAKITGECSLKLSKKLSQKKKRFLKKKRQVCLANETDKLCYQSCCRLKKKQIRQRRKKIRKAKRRRT